MVLQRSAGGNTAYFMGEVSSTSWPSYFPALYLFKEHLAFHIFTFIALIYSIRNILKTKEKNLSALAGWMKDNFVLTSGMIFIGVYWMQAVTGNLNIGVRHVLPTFPFIYLLVSRQIIRWSKVSNLDNPQTLADWIRSIYETCLKTFKKHLVIIFLALWIIFGTIAVFPFYLSYYNELAGGTLYGYKIAVDSNYDWGQDLKRLVKFVDENKLKSIAVDYFGGGNPRYYLGEKFEPWWSAKGAPASTSASLGGPPERTWFAISATFRQEAFAKPVKNFRQNPEDTYPWLKNKIPVARAGTSIFIYKF
jgi:hypothetical protein